MSIGLSLSWRGIEKKARRLHFMECAGLQAGIYCLCDLWENCKYHGCIIFTDTAALTQAYASAFLTPAPDFHITNV